MNKESIKAILRLNLKQFDNVSATETITVLCLAVFNLIDCSTTEIYAILEVFGDTVDILLCHWHIKRAWDSHIKKDGQTSTRPRRCGMLYDVKIDENLYKCQSFTNTDIVYSVVVLPSGYIVSNPCPAVNGICKHMFLVSRIKVIPYYAHHSTLHSSSAPPTSVSSAPRPVSPSPPSPPSASSAFTSASTTFNSINTMDFDNKIALLEKKIVKSVRDARKRC
ncbi:hypothetical protein [Absidia glauca]|uniref:SWIM-type domain-containing protein n=1 Tax=Absidia glauca TaxID=4829 RepID=A0A163J6W0_ABSGL|nr:hypothetical protein [Absidia glauca]